MKSLFSPAGLLATVFVILGASNVAIAATTIDFGALGLTNDIANAATSGANLTAGPFSFDVLDCSGALPCTLGSDGINDITLRFRVIPEDGTDIYGGGTLDDLRGTTHDITQQPNGLLGTTPIGNSGSNESTTGDVHGFQIEVDIAPHLTILAKDFTVNQGGVNSASEVFESSSVVFHDVSDSAYGTATYTGFWDGTPQGTNGGTNTTNVSSSPYSTTGSGVYIAADTGVVDISDSDVPIAGTASSSDNFSPNANTDAGLGPNDPIGGFTWTVLYEDVATTTTEDAKTTIETLRSARLISIDVTAVPEPSSFLFLGLIGLVGCTRQWMRCRFGRG